MVGECAIGPAAMLLEDDACGACPHFPVPSSLLVAVGHRNTGPTPQVIPSRDCAGERKKLCSVSLRPKRLSKPAAGAS